MVKNSGQRIVFPILDADGDPVTGAASDTPDSEYSLDGGSFADIADEIHELATASGIYYLDLAAGETNGDVVCIQVKTATAGTKTTVLVFYTSAQSLDTMDAAVDAIKTVVDAIPTTAMRGTDSAALASSWTAVLATALANYTAVRAGYLDELAAANLPTDVAAIPTTAMRGTDNAATAVALAIVDAIIDKLNSAMELDGAVYRFTENALEEAPSGTGGDATAANQARLIKILTNKWEIAYSSPNWQMIIYDDDGTTPLYTFNLTRGGDPTSFSPDLREPA